MEFFLSRWIKYKEKKKEEGKEIEGGIEKGKKKGREKGMKERIKVNIIIFTWTTETWLLYSEGNAKNKGKTKHTEACFSLL
jgi:hypothetical protein